MQFKVKLKYYVIDGQKEVGEEYAEEDYKHASDRHQQDYKEYIQPSIQNPVTGVEEQKKFSHPARQSDKEDEEAEDELIRQLLDAQDNITEVPEKGASGGGLQSESEAGHDYSDTEYQNLQKTELEEETDKEEHLLVPVTVKEVKGRRNPKYEKEALALGKQNAYAVIPAIKDSVNKSRPLPLPEEEAASAENGKESGNILPDEEYTSLLKLKNTIERKLGILEKENRTQVDEDKTGKFNSPKDYIKLFTI